MSHFFEDVQEERNAIGKHLCVCLLLGHLMALTLLDKSYFHLSQDMCVAAAVCLHYIFLAAFMWMAVEGHHLYRMVVRVFDTGRDFSRIYLWLGYGTPLLIVGATGVVTLILQDYGYADDELCWLSSPFYVWAFMGPVFVITGVKMVFLVLALKVTLAAATQQIKAFRNRVKVWIMGWFLLSLLLIITWLVGFFYIQYYHSFAYAFFTLNGLQGILIFFMRVVFNDKVKTAILKRSEQSPVMDKLYKIFWSEESRMEKDASKPSPWVLSSSSASRDDLASIAVTLGWSNASTKPRSSTRHSCISNVSNTSVLSSLEGEEKVNQHPGKPTKSVLTGGEDNFQPWLKKKGCQEETLEISVLKSSKTEILEIWNNLRSESVMSEVLEEFQDAEVQEQTTGDENFNC